tara:strand:- start:155 stop:340 length:186 start_codon:yes stop_codon:yes gene_type:complete
MITEIGLYQLTYTAAEEGGVNRGKQQYLSVPLENGEIQQSFKDKLDIEFGYGWWSLTRAGV